MPDLPRAAVRSAALVLLLVAALGAAASALAARSVAARSAQADGTADGTAATSPAAAERALFDGATLSGWDGDPRFWSVEDGAIVGRSTAETPCERTTYLVWTGESFADFELELDFRIRAGNSGVQVRSARAAGERWDVVGYQADLETGPDWTGGFYEQGGRGVLVRRGERVVAAPDGTLARTRFADADALQALVRAGEWNRYRVVARGPRLELFVNGARTAVLVDHDAERARASGTLALQLHQGPPMEVRFRDLRLRALPPAAADGTADAETDPGGPGAAAPAEAERANAAPRWIWSSPEPRAGETAWLRRALELAAPPVRARLVGTCDNAMEVFLDGDLVLASDAWEAPVAAELAERLAAGPHVLAVRARNADGPAGLVLALELEHADGRRELLGTDASWRAARAEPDAGWTGAAYDDSAWPAAADLGRLGVDPWGAPGLLAERASWGATPAAEIVAPPGFTVELVHSVPRSTQGSWVSLCADDRGRLYASDQYGALWRVTPPPAGTLDGAPAAAARVEPVAVELGEAHGLCWAFDALYVVVCGAGHYASGLYRVRDTDGDDRLDAVELLEPLDGTGEHGPHAVLPAPDGRSLLVVAGNHTRLPATLAASRVPRVWAEDQLLPRRPDPNGHAVGVTAPGGWLCRTDPDGGAWELLATGMRNAYDVAVAPDGELFTFDSDMEWDVGLPWYRPTRVLHLVSGAEFGWRHGSGKWPAYWPDAVPAVVDVGLASPTGVVHGAATGFPPPYDRALLVADWSYGTIYAVHLEPDGASWRGVAEIFVQGRPLPVTDLATTGDGTLWFTVGGRRAQSGLYRVRATAGAGTTIRGASGGASASAAGSDASSAAAGARANGERDAGARANGESDAELARGLRRTLERFHGVRHAGAVDAAWPHLASPDRFVRFAARTAIEHRDPAEWAERALAETEPRATVEAGLALVRVAGEQHGEAVLARVVDLLERADEAGGAALEPALEHAVLRVAGLCLIRGSVTDRALVERLARALEARFPRAEVGAADAKAERLLDRERARLLARLDRAALVAPALARVVPAFTRVDAAATQEERIFYAELLSRQRSGWTVERRRRYLGWLDHARDALAGGASLAKYLGAMRADALAATPAAERAALETWLASRRVIGKAPEAPSPLGAPRFVSAWTLAELEPALARLAGRAVDPARGRQLAEHTRCFDCHRFAGAGGSTGPDLTGVGARFSPRDLAIAILEPSETVSDQYQDVEVVTTDEELVVGRLLEDAADGVVLLGLPPDETELFVPRAEIARVRPHPLSRMPAGLVDVLDEEELLDLLAYLLAGG